METLTIPKNASKGIHKVVEHLVLDNTMNNTILDIPCGHGAFTYQMRKHQRDIYAADIEQDLMFDHEQFKLANMNDTLPYADNFFDSVVSIEGIEHLENPFTFIREAFRVLKKDGELIVSTPNISSMRSRWRWMLTGHHNKCKSPLNELKPTPLHHINMTSYHELRYMLHTNGFKIDLVKTNRIKLASWSYVFLYPFSLLKSFLVYNKEEKDADQRILNKDILKAMHSKNIFFGESMIIKARKI